MLANILNISTRIYTFLFELNYLEIGVAYEKLKNVFIIDIQNFDYATEHEKRERDKLC